MPVKVLRRRLIAFVSEDHSGSNEELLKSLKTREIGSLGKWWMMVARKKANTLGREKDGDRARKHSENRIIIKRS